jgi:hypothetical protein
MLSDKLFVHDLRPHPQQVWLQIEKNCDFHAFLNLLPHRFISKLVQSFKQTDRFIIIQLRDKPRLQLPNILDVLIPNARILYPSVPHARCLLQDACINLKEGG